MARHEVIIHENTSATSAVAPYLGNYISKETLSIEKFASAVGAKCGLPAIQVSAIIEGSFQALEDLEREGLVRIHTDIGVICAVIKGSFPTADAAFDPARNSLELALRLDDALRLDLADTVPTIITDANLTKLRVDNVMDLEEERPMNLIHGRHVFRVAGFNMVLDDEGAAAYLENAQGTTFPLVIDEVVSKQLFKAHTAELLPAGDYKLVVKSRAGDAAGPLQTSSRRVKYMRVADPEPGPATVAISGVDSEGSETGTVVERTPIRVHGTGLGMGEGDALYMKRSDLGDDEYHQIPAWAITVAADGTQLVLDDGDTEEGAGEFFWSWFEDFGGFDAEHHGITLKLVSHGGVPSSEPQTVTANADVVLT